MKNSKYVLVIIIILLGIGAFLRFYHLSQQPYWMDEGYTVNAVLSVIEKGNTTLDSGENYFCPLYCYPSAYISKILGNNAYSFRFLSAISGLIFIFFIYYFSKKIFDEKTALLIFFFTTFSYWQIAWSRQARWYTLFALFFWLAVFFFYQYSRDKKQKNKSLVLSIIFTILAILTHKLAYLLPVIFIVWIVVARENKQKKIILIALFFAILIFLDRGFNLNFLNPLFEQISLSYNLPYYLNFYLRNYWLFIFFSFVALFEAKRKNKIYFLLLPLFAYLLSLSFLTNIVHYRYLFHLTPVFYIIGSVGIVKSASKIKPKFLKATFILIIVIVYFASGQGVLKPLNFYSLESDNPMKFDRPYYAYTPQPDFNKAYGKIKKLIKNDEIIISSHPHFNKIFLGQSGYWIKYNYIGIDNRASLIKNDREYYVGAKVIDDLEELKNITTDRHGYIVFDYMAADGRIRPGIIEYINKNMNLIFYNEINAYSKIWVYEF